MPAASSTSATSPELAHDPGVFRTQPKGVWRDQRVPQRGWRAPHLVGREDLLAAQERELCAALHNCGRAAVSVVGPRGSGTTSIAECAVATFSERFFGRRSPLVLRVDTSQCRTPGLMVKALFHQIDPAIQVGGASTEFLSMLLLRRLRTLGRPAVIWLDQVHTPAEAHRVARALACADRALPEGTDGLPPLLVVASGSREIIPADVEAVRVGVPPLLGAPLMEAIRARAALAYHMPPSPAVLRALADLAVASGRGLPFVGDLLGEAGTQAEAQGSDHVALEDVVLPRSLPRHGADAEGFGELLLEVLRVAEEPSAVGELRRRLVTRCAENGLRAPTQARLWRHLVRLERKGLLTRQVRVGGSGGSRTLVALAERV